MNCVYVYKRTEEELWTVGFYGPDGRWQAESDHGSPGQAARRVAWLNGNGCVCATETAVAS